MTISLDDFKDGKLVLIMCEHLILKIRDFNNLRLIFINFMGTANI